MSGNKNGGQGNNNAANNGNHPGHGKPSDLGQKVDWMTYSHEALYKMIHEGVDLKAAGSAQADWTAVGKQLTDVHRLLARAIAQSQQAWSGESADRAREALESVEKWALNTSDHAENVAKCIGEEIQHVQTAREMMPVPVPRRRCPTRPSPRTPAPRRRSPRRRSARRWSRPAVRWWTRCTRSACRSTACTSPSTAWPRRPRRPARSPASTGSARPPWTPC
ncbi:PPE domain-containing protein [Actinosynnema sp. CA-248983]